MKKLHAGVESTYFYNYLNLPEIIYNFASLAVKAQFQWLADGTKCSALNSNETGYEYFGSMIFKGNRNMSLSLEQVQFSDGVLKPTATGSGSGQEIDYFYRDHLGSVRYVQDTNGNIKQRNDYLPLGMKIENYLYETNDNRFLFNGKELQNAGNLRYPWLDYGARMYNPWLGRWLTTDPLAEKNYSVSPYAYCLNNPVSLVDPDGRVVREYEIYAKDRMSGNDLPRNGVSPKMEASLKDYMTTDDGRAFVGQFAKAGDVIGEYKFDKDGGNSQHTLEIWDRSYSEGTNGWNVPSNVEGSYDAKIDKNGIATIRVVVNSYMTGSKYSTTEVFTHEGNLHGYKAGENVKGQNMPNGDGGAKDHDAIKNNRNIHLGRTN